ncbi:MAG: type II toxin-antitoxin system RelE/ParE family toxin [Prevotellaceae bacterium]|jgi:plasmid stabilization system protein ParE|nr:type II toxin-antitoxin system RelE/ParE family toxin [Prevotellaceae bacterium]
MRNTYEILWTMRAENDLDNILGYLENNWTEKEINNFAQLLDKNLDLISSNPNMFVLYDIDKNIHKCVIAPQTSIYYVVDYDKNTVTLLTLFDNRRNPKILNF